jgi:hypothetical protein
MKKTVEHNPFLFFLIFTFSISWITGFPTVFVPGKFEGLSYLSNFGPALAALIVVGIAEGSNGIKKLIQSLFQWRGQVCLVFGGIAWPSSDDGSDGSVLQHICRG